ncbi:CHASE2 domain-containing protein [Endothiovibrio diazotrophicus]
MARRSPRSLARHAVPLAFALAVAAFVGLTPFVEGVVAKALDRHLGWIADWQGYRSSDRVVLIEVDQASLDAFEAAGVGFPLPRELYGMMAQYARDGGARAVLIDILFNNRTPYGEEQDRRFGEALRHAGRSWVAVGAGRDAVAAPLAVTPPPGAYTLPGIDRPVAALVERGIGEGAVTGVQDVDHLFRATPPLLRTAAGGVIPSLPFAPLAAGAGPVEWRADRVRFGDLQIPLDGRGLARPWFPGDGGHFRWYSASAVVDSAARLLRGEAPSVPPEAFGDRYVVIGYTAPGLYDLKPFPFAGQAPGMVFHAVVLDAALQGRFLRAAPWVAGVLLALAAVGGFTLAARADTLWRAVGWTAGTLLALYAVSLGLLWWGWLPPWQPLGALVGGGLIWGVLHRFTTKEVELGTTLGIFERMVSPEIAQSLVQQRELVFEPHERELVVLFCDLAGFTTLSEILGKEIQPLLNRYYGLVHEAIRAEAGTLNKFIGDAAMGFWGAPQGCPAPAARAARAAWAIDRAFAAFAGEIRRELGHEVALRIGVDRGRCVTGVVGSAERFEYTAIGNAVNQAARLESLNKQYGSFMLFGAAAWEEASSVLAGREVDRVTVKGRSEPVSIYQPLALREEAGEAERRLIEGYAAAFADYLAGRFGPAAGRFAALADEFDDPVSRVMARRARNYERSPPAAWDGVYRHTTK